MPGVAGQIGRVRSRPSRDRIGPICVYAKQRDVACTAPERSQPPNSSWRYGLSTIEQGALELYFNVNVEDASPPSCASCEEQTVPTQGVRMNLAYYWYEAAHLDADTRPGRHRRHEALLRKPRQSADRYALRPHGDGGLRTVRAHDAALRQARPSACDHHVDGERVAVTERIVWERPFCHVISFDRDSQGAASPAQAADRGADVGPLRDAAARHRRGLPADPPGR